MCVKIHTQRDKLNVFRIDERRYVAGFATLRPIKKYSFVSLCTCVHICGGDFN